MKKGVKYTWSMEQNCLVECGEEPKRQTHYVITDDIPEGIQSMVTKKWYTSKARLREEYRERGFIEKGNDENNSMEEKNPKHDEEIEAAVTEAYFAVRDGMAELSEIDKHRCQLNNRNLDRYNYDRRERDEFGNIIE